MSSLYIHIPFRRTVSPYREEYYEVDKGPYDSFINALLLEVSYYAEKYGHQESIETIYIGGGSPSLLSPHELQRILTEVNTRFDVDGSAEVTAEGNPEDLSLAYLEQLRVAGVNRMSVAVESFFPTDLEQLGCRHSPQQAKASLMRLPQVGFTNHSIDLRFGIADQPLEYWQANLQRSVRHEIPHIATYRASSASSVRSDGQNSRDRQAAEPSVEETNKQYQFAMDYLQQQNYLHYELSHFSRPGFASRHLQYYWDHANYIGLGPSAHSFWWSPNGGAYRWSNTKNVARYRDLLRQQELPLDAKERVSRTMLANEYIMLQLQTGRGLNLDMLKKRYAVDFVASNREELELLKEKNWIERLDINSIRLTDEGKFRHEAIASRLLIGNDDLLTP